SGNSPSPLPGLLILKEIPILGLSPQAHPKPFRGNPTYHSGCDGRLALARGSPSFSVLLGPLDRLSQRLPKHLDMRRQQRRQVVARHLVHLGTTAAELVPGVLRSLRGEVQ